VNSHHHPAQINAVLNTIILRSHRISEKNNFPIERKRVEHILRQNGYEAKAIQRMFGRIMSQDGIRKREDSGTSDADTPAPKKAFLLYIHGVTERIGNILRKHEIKTMFIPHLKIGNFLGSVKHKTPFQVEGVYEITCETCGKKYIGDAASNPASKNTSGPSDSSNRINSGGGAQDTRLTSKKQRSLRK
jgi:hypothetical protein